MPRYIEKIEKITLPVVALRGAVAFPSVTLSFEVEDELCINAAEAAFETDSFVLICATKTTQDKKLTHKELFTTGTISKIKHFPLPVLSQRYDKTC